MPTQRTCWRQVFTRRSLGHSKVSITLDLYSHVLPYVQEDAVAKVDAALQAALNKRETKG
jgi:hypothetical protein